MSYRRVGIIGAGVIGQAIFDAIVTQNLAAVNYVLVDEPFAPPANATRLREHLTTDVRRALAAPTDLVIEAAHPDVVALLGADLLAKGVAEGPDLGVTLRRLESDWIDSDFTLGRDDLLARL